MSERFRPSPEYYSRPKEPSLRVRSFLAENPNASHKDRMRFVLSIAPDAIFDGGTAVSYYCPGQREPDDVDFIASRRITDEFAEAKGFDARDPEFWWQARRIETTPELISYLLAAVVPFPLDETDQRTVLIQAPALLAVSKSIPYVPRGSLIPKVPRPKDDFDVSLLNIPPAKIQKIIERVAPQLAYSTF